MPVNITYLRSLTSGDRTAEKELLKLFLQEADNTMLDMVHAVLNEDNEDWRKTAHKLKGAAASLGAADLSKLCEKAETYFKANDHEKEEILCALQDELASVRRYVTKSAAAGDG